MRSNSFNPKLTRKQRRLKDKEATSYVVDERFKMEVVVPKTQHQKDFKESYDAGFNIAAIGTAGTGKTYLSLSLALADVMKEDNPYEKVIIIRSAVQTRDQGFMPGTLKEKIAYYEGPYIEIVNKLFEDSRAYGILKSRGLIEFMSSSFVRGLTFDNAIIIVDEGQSMSAHEISSIMTRVGENSKIIICGDTKQNDLIKSKYDTSGLPRLLRVLDKMKCFRKITFTHDDILRSNFVREFIVADEQVPELA